MSVKASEALLSESGATKPRVLEKTVSLESCNNDDDAQTECTCKEVGYGAGDAVFASVVVAPLVVGVWRGTWGLMDLHPQLFPYAQSYLIGITIHVCFALIRSQLLSRSVGAWRHEGGAGRWLRERVLSRVYTYVFILGCIMHWRGGWGLLDAVVVAILPRDDDPHRGVLYAAFTISFYICMMLLRSSRNFLAPPYFLVTDGKEATYMFTTRFRKTVSGARRTSVTAMRGSTAGLADTLAGASTSYSALLATADAIFASAVVAPAVVTYWKSAWTLMDLYVLPERPVFSAAACATFGLLVGLIFCVCQSLLSKCLSPDKGRLTYYVASRVYTAVAGVACVAAWRGVWNLLNECTGDSAKTLFSTTAAATLSLAVLRALRNICAVPFAVSVDSPQDYFNVPTMFRTNSRDMALFALDCLFSVGVVGSLVVFVWRGSWALLDIYLHPGAPLQSCLTSVVVGYSLVAATFALQAPARWTAARLHGTPRLLLADFYHLVSFFATVNVWRGVWGLLDIYLFPESPKLSNWCSHVGSLALLVLLNCSNTVIVRGVYIDAEEPAGECVVFPCHYLRLYFHKERTKKRHKRAMSLVAETAAKKSEDQSLPLQLPEDKV